MSSSSSSVMIASKDVGRSSGGSNIDSAIASRKLAAAELRKARNAARDPRSRLFSDSSDEAPKGILKNGGSFPTKRSASECVDDLSQIMADLNLTIQDFSNGRYCPHHRYSPFNEEEEEDERAENDDHHDADDDDDDYEDDHSNLGDEEVEGKIEKKNVSNNNSKTKLGNNNRKCDCNISQSGDSDTASNQGKPKKSVRFDERVYEAFFFAARLYDRRNFAKYHFSSRHHPPPKPTNKPKKNRNKKKSSNSKSSDGNNNSNKAHNVNNQNSESQTNGAGGSKPTKSQRAKQSKRDKLKQRRRSETNSDDQGYCSSLHSSSDS